MGTLAQRRGDLMGAEASFADAARIATALGDTMLLAKIEQNRGVVASVRGDWSGAVACYQRSLAAYRAAGDVDAVVWVLNNLGVVYRRLGEFERALSVLLGGLEIARAGAGGLTEGVLSLNVAEVYVELGDCRRAVDHCDRALTLAVGRGDAVRQAEALRVRAMLESRSGATAVALATLESAHTMAESALDALLVAEIIHEKGVIRALIGDRSAAATAFTTARDDFLTIGATQDAEHSAELLQELVTRG